MKLNCLSAPTLPNVIDTHFVKITIAPNTNIIITIITIIDIIVIITITITITNLNPSRPRLQNKDTRHSRLTISVKKHFTLLVPQ